MENSLFLDIFIVLYLLLCFLWYQNFNINFINGLITYLGLDHAWPMFVQPQLFNVSISCNIYFKDTTSTSFVFSNTESKSLMHRKYLDSMTEVEDLKGALADYVINFSGIENIDSVDVIIDRKKIEPYDENWNEYYEQSLES